MNTGLMRRRRDNIFADHRQIQAAHVAQLDSLQLGPEALARIQFRGIRRQALQMDALRRAVREELGDGATAVNRCPIPYDDHLPGDFTPQVLKKGDDVVRIKGTVLVVEVQPPLGRNRGDGRQMIARPPLL
jgi:hypothetical protein